MKKKRIVAFGIVFTLIMQLCSFNAAFADENAEKGLSVLQKIGVVSQSDIENAPQAVSRSKFTYYAAKAFGRLDINDKMYFKDIPVEHWANPHISALVEMGVIDIAEDGLFNPDSPVTPEQAYKIMLVGLGYKKAEDMSGYTMAANEADILIATNNPTTLTLKEAAEIIYNAMCIGAPRFLAYGEKLTDENLKDTTLMARHSLIEDEGVVTAVFGASTDENYEAREENEVYIDGELYTVDADVDFEALLGRCVEFIYREDNMDDKTVLYAEAVNDEVIEITSDLIKEFNPDSYTLKYYKSNETTKTSSFTFSDGIKVIYNGKPYSGRISTVMNEFINGTKHGKVTIIESGRGQEEMLVVKSLRTVVAKNYSENNQVFFDYYSPVDNFDFSEYEVVRYVNPDGTKTVMPTAFIAVLDVAESEDKKTAEVIVCDKQVQGELTSIQSAENTEIEIVDTMYEMTDTAWNKFGTSIKIGTTVKAWFDSIGRIVYIEPSGKTGMQPGYLMENLCLEGDEGVYYVFKMFANGAVSKFELADRVELDAKLFKLTDYKQFFLNFPLVSEITESKVTIAPQVIRYELNADGKIAKIDTTALGKNEDEDKTLRLVHDADGDESRRLIYTSSLKRFGLNYMYDSAYTNVFVLPQGVEDGKITISGNKVEVDDNMYSSSGSFASLTSYSLKIYDCDADNPFAEIIVSEQAPMVNEMNVYMFKGVSRVLDDEEMPATAITCIGASGEKTIILDESLNNAAQGLKKGDIIIIDTDLQGKKAYKIEKYFKGDELIFNNGENRNASNPYWYRGTYNPYGDSFIITARQKVRNVTKGYAYDVSNNVLEVMYEFDENVSERVNAKSVPVIIYDKSTEKGDIYEGTLTDIDTYKTTGNPDLVLTGYYSENAKCIFVYKQ